MLRFALLLGLVFGVSNAAHAIGITYTISVVATGSLGGTPFANETVTYRGIGDTDNLVGDPDFPSISIAGMAIEVSNVGTATANYPVNFFVNQGASTAGVGYFGSILNITDPAFSGYSLGTSIGPITNTTFGSGFVMTNLGALTLDSRGLATFTAVVESGEPVATPEPASLAVLAMGLAGMLGVRRRRG
jgi:hypothetical protein